MVTKIYANAVAKYNEGKLLDAEKLHRLADADFESAVKMLCDYGYGGGTVGEGHYDIDAFISRETGKLIEYARTDAPDPHLAQVLTAGFLYGNAKAYYKARVAGKENAAAIYVMDDDEVRAGIEKREYAALPVPMADALTHLDEIFADGAPDPKTVDTVLTKAMFTDMLGNARASKSKTVRRYVAARIDTTNILSALRARALGMPASVLPEMFIGGGKMHEEDIAELFSAEDPLRVLRDSPFEALAGAGEKIDLPHMEARADELLDGVWSKEAENMQSLCPFVRYFNAQLREYKTVKMILTCLKNNARGEILPRLRQSV